MAVVMMRQTLVGTTDPLNINWINYIVEGRKNVVLGSQTSCVDKFIILAAWQFPIVVMLNCYHESL